MSGSRTAAAARGLRLPSKGIYPYEKREMEEVCGDKYGCTSGKTMIRDNRGEREKRTKRRAHWMLFP